MAKHKAATEIVIAQEERSAFAEFVDRYKWHGVSVLVVGAAAILWMQSSSEAAVEKNRADWEKLYEAQIAAEDSEALATAAKEIARPEVAVWAKIGQAMMLIDDRAYGDAQQVLAQAMGSGPAILTDVTFPIGPDGAETPLIKHMHDRVMEEQEWAEANPYVLENPDLPTDAPRVQLETDKGMIVLGLYNDRAPKHVANFIALVESGYYDETRFHRIKPGGFIQGGDPNSKLEDPATWGLGGPESTVPPEDSQLIHTEGVLAAAKKGGATDSSGSQFYITASRQHQFDGDYVVYGKVLEGLEIVEEISNGEIRPEKAETPVELVTIIKATVL